MQKCKLHKYEQFYVVSQLMSSCTLHMCYAYLVVDLLKKYYHNLLANMIPEDARNVNISKAEWLTAHVTTLCCMTNKQFLDILIMATENNHQLLRFCSTYNLFMDRSSNKNIIKAFKSG